MKLFDRAPAFPPPQAPQQPDYQVTLPRDAKAYPGLKPPPTTIAPPLSGILVHTANNRPEDPTSWQNEPGPGVGEPAAFAVVHRAIEGMEKVSRVIVPAGRKSALRP